MSSLLKFGKANAKLIRLEKKLGKKVATFSILSGWSCPGAKDCLSKAVLANGKTTIKDGPNTQFRCFSASQEALYPGVYKQRKNNMELLRACKTQEEIVGLIEKSLPKADIIRIHVAGDYFNSDYFLAWCEIAKKNPHIIFYSYTKSINVWVSNLKSVPQNLRLTASYGGRYDSLIIKHNLKYAKVVFSQYEARKLKIPIDHNDTHALGNKSFGLLLHSAQPKGSPASRAWQRIKGTKFGGYNRKVVV